MISATEISSIQLREKSPHFWTITLFSDCPLGLVNQDFGLLAVYTPKCLEKTSACATPHKNKVSFSVLFFEFLSAVSQNPPFSLWRVLALQPCDLPD